MTKDNRPLFSDDFLDELAEEISILCGEPADAESIQAFERGNDQP